MRKLIDKTHVQLKMNKAAQVACELDAKDKHHAQNVDDLMHQLHTSSNSLSLYPGVEGEVRVLNPPQYIHKMLSIGNLFPKRKIAYFCKKCFTLFKNKLILMQSIS